MFLNVVNVLEINRSNFIFICPVLFKTIQYNCIVNSVSCMLFRYACIGYRKVLYNVYCKDGISNKPNVDLKGVVDCSKLST